MSLHFKKHHWLLFIMIPMILLVGFVPAKYAADFKKNKKNIESLAILNPVVHVVANNNLTTFTDSTLIIQNQRLFDSITCYLLSKKYSLEKVSLPDVDIHSFTGMFAELEQSPKTLDKISVGQLFGKHNLGCKSRYALLLVYSGQYHPAFQPHFKRNTALLNDVIVITPGNPTQAISDLSLMIIDTESAEVVFYDRAGPSANDARVPAEMEHITRSVLRKIYYK